jgi:branched-chain amino acid transport system permease protein
MRLFIEQLVNGLTLGSIYALIALGYTMVYGVLRMINFAHSEIFMFGALSGLLVVLLPLHLPWFASLPLAFASGVLCSAVAAGLMEKIAYAPLRRASRLAPLISAIGVSIVLQNAVFLWRDESLAFPNVLPETRLDLGVASLSGLQVLILFVSVALMVILQLFVMRTRLGKAMRACSQDQQAAALMGIPVNWIITLTFLIGGGLGGAAGFLNGMYYGSVKYNMGFIPGVKAFTAAVLGGIGNIPGAMLGGILMGVLEALGAGFLPRPEWKDVFSFSILILVLVFRPSGLLGERVAEKV